MVLNLVSFWVAKARLSLGISCVSMLCGAVAFAQDPVQPAGSTMAVPAPQPVPAPAPVALAPVPPPPPALPLERPLPPGQLKYGFLIAAAFGVRPVATSSGLASAPIAINSAVQGGLALGFKAGRVMFSVGADLTSIDQRSSGMPSMYERTTSFLIAPALQIALVRSSDQRIELVASLRGGAGTTTSSESMSTRPVLAMYEIAPAVRWWAHKHFAIQGLAGYSGNYIILRNTSALSSASTASLGVHSAVASIGTLGVF